MRLTLAVLAAGRSSRFGRLKQLEPVGPSGEAVFEYAVHDAIRAGADRVILVSRPALADRLEGYARARLGSFPTELVVQRVDDLPTGFRPPFGRSRPWGTAHAVLALRHTVKEPFVVVNADDYYGPNLIGRIVRRLRDALTTGDPSHFVAGFTLRNTSLSSAGGVNRAVLSCDASLFVEQVDEFTDIESRAGRFSGRDPGGDHVILSGDERVSMNLWGFQPAIFEPLWHAFERFHRASRTPESDEFALSTALGGLIQSRRIRIRALATEDRGYSMTFEDDRSLVQSGVNQAVASGHYPTDLVGWFERRQGRVPG